MGQDDVGRERGQFRRVSANVGGIGRGPARVDPHVAADGPAQERQRLLERPDAGLKFRVVRGSGQEHADAPHALALLRARRERPVDGGRGAGEQEDELASRRANYIHSHGVAGEGQTGPGASLSCTTCHGPMKARSKPRGK